VSGFSPESARLQVPLNALPFHEWSFPDGTLGTQFFRTDAGYLLRFPDLADFQVSPDGLSVTCSPTPGVTDATLHHLYLNQVLPLMLSKQGKLVFHASAVEIADGAVAFVAESGRGKSTLAASFAIGGFRFLTDDSLVAEVSGHGYRVLPSHPSIRLWEDSGEALIRPGAQAAPALEVSSKSRFLAGEDMVFCDQPRPLRLVYFLGDGRASEITFQHMSAAEALVEWVKYSFLLDVEERPLLAFHFDEVAKLANQLICCRLDYPRRFEELVGVRLAIIEHATKGGKVV
jgi:hypothetical protein